MHRLALLFLVLIISLSAGCQAKQAELNGQGSDGGIAVRGDWTIEIRNEDGSVAETMKFHNDLHAEGHALLVNFISTKSEYNKINLHTPWIEFYISTDGDFAPGTFGSGSTGDAVCKNHEDLTAEGDLTVVKADISIVNYFTSVWKASCVLDDDQVEEAFYSGTLSGVSTRWLLGPDAPLSAVLGPTYSPIFTKKLISDKIVTETQTIHATVEIFFGTK